MPGAAMDEAHNPYASPKTEPKHITGGECLLVDGNVNVAKNKGPGQLLLTRTAVFALRSNNQAAMTGAAVGGLIGALVGHFIEKHRAKKRGPPEHLDDPEIQDLDPSIRKKIERASLLAKLPLDSNLKVQRTTLGFKLTQSDGTTIVYQGLFRKKKIAAYLAGLGIDAA